MALVALVFALAAIAVASPVTKLYPHLHPHLQHQYQQPPPVDVTIHDNNVYFDSNVSVTATFSLDRFAISDGQPFKGVTFSGSSLDVHAGRHGTVGPASEFIVDLTLLNMVASTHIIATEPKELNFAIFGTLNITLGSEFYSLPGFRIGQGHYSTTNNWWLAASYCTNDPATGDVTLVCKLPQSDRKIQFHGESSDHFYVISA
jgi:hypothetical protein